MHACLVFDGMRRCFGAVMRGCIILVLCGIPSVPSRHARRQVGAHRACFGRTRARCCLVGCARLFWLLLRLRHGGVPGRRWQLQRLCLPRALPVLAHLRPS